MDLDSALKDKPAEGASALEILRADHAEARRLFAEYRSSSAQQRKIALRSLCLALELHDHIEREVFYPAVKDAASDLVGQFEHAHEDVTRIVETLRDRESCDSECDAAVTQLQQQVEDHVMQEENELFPRLEKLGAAKLGDLGLAIVRRKEDLTRSTQEFENPAT